VIREPLSAAEVGHRDGFRWRGKEVSRVEGFSDAVFGFALTLLVVSLEVPRTFGELLHALGGFIGFGLCFVLFIQIWFRHYQFFRRYGLQDRMTMFLNSLLLFVMLAFVYPLKFLFGTMSGLLLGDPTQVRLASGELAEVIRVAEVPTLFYVYNAGFLLIYGVFLALYLNAHRRREQLALDALELFETRASMLECGIFLGVASLSMVAAAIFQGGGVAGFTYFLTAPAFTILGMRAGPRRKALRAEVGR
jgi:hypothetical protein